MVQSGLPYNGFDNPLSQPPPHHHTDPGNGISSSSTNSILLLATSGSTADKIIKGFLVGAAFGLIFAVMMCCWFPCLSVYQRRVRLRDRRDDQSRSDLEGGDGMVEAWTRRRDREEA
ncbi:hypothetical protein PT974_05005 [Cladobotryum mycophilum]|uniref:Uncharacterized protein n=1 Tax=Cladobotryum mycophilum TaxID=491253 RepID=A0ABR0SQS8_9HYPO